MGSVFCPIHACYAIFPSRIAANGVRAVWLKIGNASAESEIGRLSVALRKNGESSVRHLKKRGILSRLLFSHSRELIDGSRRLGVDDARDFKNQI